MRRIMYVIIGAEMSSKQIKPLEDELDEFTYNVGEAERIRANRDYLDVNSEKMAAATDTYTQTKIALDGYSKWKDYVIVHISTPDGVEFDISGKPASLLPAVELFNAAGWNIEGLST
jgi:hypothetical protein